nr:uncharacterized protein LOC128696872 [Cherax quadricarinatus]
MGSQKKTALTPFTNEKGWVPPTRSRGMYPPSINCPNHEIVINTTETPSGPSLSLCCLQVKQYEAGELEACTAARRARGATTWVAFVGDSTMRQKIHSFLSFLPPQLTYTYLIGDTEVTLEDFTLAVSRPEHKPQTYDVLGHRTSTTTTSSSTSQPTRSHPHNASGYHSSNGSSHTPAQRTDGEYNSANRGMHIVNNRNTGRKIYDVHSSNNGTFLKNPEKTKINSAGIKNKGIIEYSSKPLLEADTRLESYDLRVTLVWAPTGSTMDHPTPRTGRKVTKLHDLATAIVVPDVVVVGKVLPSLAFCVRWSQAYICNNEIKICGEHFSVYMKNPTYVRQFSFGEVFGECARYYGDSSVVLYECIRGVRSNLTVEKKNNYIPLSHITLVTNALCQVPLFHITLVTNAFCQVPLFHITCDTNAFCQVPLVHITLVTNALCQIPLFHITIIHVARYRWFNFESPKASAGIQNLKAQWGNMLYFSQFNDTIPFTDSWLWRQLRSTGAWQWDSSLPFNLANVRECHQLSMKHILTLMAMANLWWKCKDPHHSSYETNSVEIQMLLNLLCNPYLDTAKQYCCSGK